MKKVAPIVVFMFRDTEDFSSAISQALHPNPSSSFTLIEDSFEFSLEGYGIKDLRASGNIFHYVDNQGIYKVSVVVMQHYEPPVLACALNEVLNEIAGDKSSLMPTLLVPFLVESSKVKGQSKSLRSDESKALIFGIQIIHEIGEILASSTGLQFSGDRVMWNPKKTSKEAKEPWRALYG